MSVRVTLCIGQFGLIELLLNDCFAEVDHGRGEHARKDTGNDEGLNCVMTHITQLKVIHDKRHDGAYEDEACYKVVLRLVFVDHRCDQTVDHSEYHRENRSQIVESLRIVESIFPIDIEVR